MFEKLDKEDALYDPDEMKRLREEDKEAKKKQCPYCDEKVEEIQYARHLIKYHSDDKKPQ